MLYSSRFLRLEKKRMRGPDVLYLQMRLQEQSYHSGPLDGIFGPQTAAAVTKFQKDKALTANGIVGPDTWSLLNTLPQTSEGSDGNALAGISITIDVDQRRLYYSSPKLSVSYSVAVGKPQTPTPLGNWVIVQKTINPGGPFGARWMRLSVPWGGYGIHGTNNPKSIGKAVSHGCIRLYNKDVIKLYDMTPLWTPVTIIGKSYSGRILRMGDSGSDVRYVQTALKELGYYRSAIDGFFGPITEQAVINFQQAQGLLVDGIVGPATWQAIQRELDIARGNVEP